MELKNSTYGGKYLVLRDFEHITKFPDDLECAVRLEVKNCPSLTSLGNNFKSTEDLTVRECKSLRAVVDDKLHAGSLQVSDCPVLGRVANTLETRSIVRVQNCPNAAYVAQHLFARHIDLTNLESLTDLSLRPDGVHLIAGGELNNCPELRGFPPASRMGSSFFLGLPSSVEAIFPENGIRKLMYVTNGEEDIAEVGSVVQRLLRASPEALEGIEVSRVSDDFPLPIVIRARQVVAEEPTAQSVVANTEVPRRPANLWDRLPLLGPEQGVAFQDDDACPISMATVAEMRADNMKMVAVRRAEGKWDVFSFDSLRAWTDQSPTHPMTRRPLRDTDMFRVES